MPSPPSPPSFGLGDPLYFPTNEASRANDPSANVLAIIQTAIQRQDDLRNAENDALQQVMALRSDHYRELREAETARIDAIRAVDVGAVAAAAQVAATQANTLATQVATSAETLRNQVAAAATASTVALTAALDPIQKDIADLRKAQYEAQGQKTQVIETRSTTGSVGMWVGLGVAAFAAISGTFLTIVGIAITYFLTKK